MNKRAIFVIFGCDEYMKQDTCYKTLFPFFMKGIIKAKDYFDMIFIIDSDWGFDSNDKNFLDTNIGKKKYLIEPYNYYRKHWENLNYAKEIHYDNILFLDNDTIIYDPQTINSGFRYLETKPGALGILDSSGQFQLGVQTILNRSLDRGERFRLTPYFSFVSKKALDKTDKEFSPKTFNAGFSVPELLYKALEGDWTDSMGWITLQLLKYQKEFPIIEWRDDRRSLYIEDNKIVQDKFLDSTLAPTNLGYYHIRNFFGGFNLINARKNRPDDYTKLKAGITPKEAVRLLMWFYIVCPQVDSFVVASDYGIRRDLWDQYIIEFLKYHNWLTDYV